MRRRFCLFFMPAASAAVVGCAVIVGVDGEFVVGRDAATDAAPVVEAAAGDASPLPPCASGDCSFVAPATCTAAEAAKTSLGCEFWPTVTATSIWSIFDFGVIVSNPQPFPVIVTVTGPKNTDVSSSIPPGEAKTFYLPWVPSLKGPDAGSCATPKAPEGSVLERIGAYHLVSSAPVAVHQFNALETEGKGGAPGKNWDTCPGLQMCSVGAGTPAKQVGCVAFFNDASLLLPTHALTGSYRVSATSAARSYLVVTATGDATEVTVKLSAAAQIVAGPGVSPQVAGGTAKFSLNAGDVVALVNGTTGDFSGSVVAATRPVQVLSGHSCASIPEGSMGCDHLEESLFPAEALGKQYVVAPLINPTGGTAGQLVKFVGNRDNTTLAYLPSVPPGCPTVLQAGEAVSCDGLIDRPFQVVASHEFSLTTFMLGRDALDPAATLPKGDPSQSAVVPIEQFSRGYVFSIPSDYPVAYVDLVGPAGASITLDGIRIDSPMLPTVGRFGVLRLRVVPNASGFHRLLADQPVGAQVLGFAPFTSVQFPAGASLERLASPAPL